MKNKTKTYLLILAVLGIWSTIGYKILSTAHPDELELNVATVDASFSPKTLIQKDTFSIQTTKRDPFLGTLTKKKKASAKKQVSKPTPIENTPQPVITYQGVVKKQNSSSQIFTLSINSQQYLLKKGQTIDDVTLVRGTAKEIVVRYNGKLKTIAIQ